MLLPIPEHFNQEPAGIVLFNYQDNSALINTLKIGFSYCLGLLREFAMSIVLEESLGGQYKDLEHESGAYCE